MTMVSYSVSLMENQALVTLQNESGNRLTALLLNSSALRLL
jgi:hypothetical protein